MFSTHFTEFTEFTENRRNEHILLNANGSNEDKVYITYLNPLFCLK